MHDKRIEDAFFAVVSGSANPAGEAPGLLADAAERQMRSQSNRLGAVATYAAVQSHCLYQFDGVLALVNGRPRLQGKGEIDKERIARFLCEQIRTRGTEVLQSLRGQFRIILLDQHADLALVVTDHLGTMPVVYCKLDNGDHAFASDSSLLLELTGQTCKLNHCAIYDYLFFHQIPSPQSVFANLQRMLPDQVLRLTRGKAETSHYWMPAFRDAEAGASAPSPEELCPTLKQAVDATSPDAKTACFLSGGLDSSSVAGTLALGRDEPTHAFTIGFDEPGYDEMEYARIVARHFGLSLHEYYLKPEDVAHALPLISAAYDEPFGNSSAVPTYFCALEAKKAGFDRLLAGDGGDELFAGNARYAKQKLFEQYARLPGFVRNILESETVADNGLYQTIWPFRKVSRYVEQATQPLPDRLESANPLHYFRNDEVFDPGFLAQIDQAEPYALMRQWYAIAPSDSYLNKMLWLDWKFTLTDNDLRKVSVMCREAGMEVCYPMLDDRVIELSVRIPPGRKLDGYDLRTWYKSGVKNMLPKEVITKKKHGFGLPFGEWLRKPGAMRDMAASSLANASQLGIFREDFVQELRRRHESVHAAHYGSLAWVVIMLEQWMSSRKLSL